VTFNTLAILPPLFIDCGICVDVSLKELMERETTMNSQLKEQIAPEIIQALIAQAKASGLTVNDYLARLLGLTNGHEEKFAPSQEPAPRNEAMFAALQSSEEILKGMPFSGSTEDSLKILYEGRAGEMYGYEPTK
jgi:hypothetical protein